jgi:hypothetical protein
MNNLLALLMMSFFCVLFTGVYIWMRRAEFGESKHGRGKTDR